MEDQELQRKKMRFQQVLGHIVTHQVNAVLQGHNMFAHDANVQQSLWNFDFAQNLQNQTPAC